MVFMRPTLDEPYWAIASFSFVGLTFYERVRIVIAWCELRQAFRHFRTDRITDLVAREERYPARRADLFREDDRGLPEAPVVLHDALLIPQDRLDGAGLAVVLRVEMLREEDGELRDLDGARRV